MTQRSLLKGLAVGSSACRSSRSSSRAVRLSLLAGLTLLATGVVRADPNFPITPQQKATAQQVAQAGVPISELAPNAPDSHVVKRGDTLWDISKLFLKSPWRWPELWGMNLQQIRNPHLIFPGQVLYLDKRNGRATLRMGQPVGGGGDVKLSPRVREGGLYDAIATVPMHLLESFFNEAIIIEDSNQLLKAPRVVATQEGRVMLARGETAYVRGDLGDRRDWRLFREPKPVRDPVTKEVLGYEAQYVGTMSLTREGAEGTGADGQPLVIPSTFTVNSIRQEAGVGDRLAPVPAREFDSLAPHAPTKDVAGAIASIYGGALAAGQSSIVALNRGVRDGMERGQVLALWRDGRVARDMTLPDKPEIKLPDERQGLLFVFRVFERTSYALIMSADDIIKVGDRFTQP
jgi:hypothetical protein